MRSDIAQAERFAVPGMFVDEEAIGLRKCLVVTGRQPHGRGLWKQVESGAADDGIARQAILPLGDLVDEHIAAVADVLHRDPRRDVVDDFAKERAIAVAFPLQLALPGDVFDGLDPAALKERLVDHMIGAAAPGFEDGVRGPAGSDAPYDLGAELIDVAVECATFPAM